MNHEIPPQMPKWVKVIGITFVVILLMVIVLHLTGNSPGFHHGIPNEVSGK